MYQFANDLEKTGYSDSRVETETGFTWTINETVSAKVNYYLERGFNMDGSRNNGEFSTQEIRAYMPDFIRTDNPDAVYPSWDSIAGQTGTGRTIRHVKGMISTVWVLLYAYDF